MFEIVHHAKSPMLSFRPEPVIWTKDGGELPDVERMIVEGRELVITSLNKTDNGTYRCEASNSLGTDIAEYKLYVYGECPTLCSPGLHVLYDEQLLCFPLRLSQRPFLWI